MATTSSCYYGNWSSTTASSGTDTYYYCPPYGTNSSWDTVTISTSDIIWYSDGYPVYVENGEVAYTWESVTITPLDPIKSHYLRMQEKIEKEWSELVRRYYRNENHTKEMQKKINREWTNYLTKLKWEEDKEKRELPEKKAQELLGLLIGLDQLEVYRKTGRMFVKGKKGEYIVKRGGGISKIEGKKIVDFCVHIESKYKCPPTDHAIALKMMLEEDDKKVVKIANRLGSREVSELPIAACM